MWQRKASDLEKELDLPYIRNVGSTDTNKTKLKGVQTMAYFNPREYFPTLQEWIRYGCDITWDDYSIMKNHGDYVQLMFPSSATKGHDTYDLYHDANGRLTKAYGHPGNAGFEGTRYY